MTIYLSGCSTAKYVAEIVKEGVDEYTREPYVASGLEALPLDDFYVYENGEVIWNTDDMNLISDELAFSFDEPYAGHNSLYEGEPYDFRGRDITTKRGVRVGDSIEAVVEAYEGIEFCINGDVDEVEPSIEFGLSVSDVAEEIHKSKGRRVVGSWTYVMKDGSTLTSTGVLAYFDEIGMGAERKRKAAILENCDHIYILSFAVEKNHIVHIGIKDHMPFWDGAYFIG